MRVASWVLGPGSWVWVLGPGSASRSSAPGSSEGTLIDEAYTYNKYVVLIWQ